MPNPSPLLGLGPFPLRKRLLGLAGESSAFNPLTLRPRIMLLADQQVFQDATLLTPAVAADDVVGGWKDLSGYGNHVLQATTNKKLLLKLGVTGGGRRGIQGDGTNDDLYNGLSNGLASACTAFTVAAVVKTPATFGGLKALFQIGAFSGGGGKVLRFTAAGKLEVLKGNVAGLGVSNTALATSTAYVVGFSYASPNGTFWVNNAPDGVISSAQTFTSPAAQITIAAQDDAAVSPSNAPLSALLYFDGLLDAIGLSRLFQWLGTYAGIDIA